MSYDEIKRKERLHRKQLIEQGFVRIEPLDSILLIYVSNILVAIHHKIDGKFILKNILNAVFNTIYATRYAYTIAI